MNYFRVEQDGMHDLSTNLGNCSDRVRDSLRELRTVGQADTGSTELTRAITAFAESGGRSLRDLATVTDGMVEGLRQTIQNYAATDQRGSQLFDMGSAPGSSGSAVSAVLDGRE